MAMPFTCGATLPIVERYLDTDFRKISRRFRHRQLEWELALSLAAFLAIVPISQARWIFHWDIRGLRAAQAVERHYTEPARAFGYIDANLAGLDYDDGLAVLQAMRDGGWPGKHLPDIVKRSIRDTYHRGKNAKRVAEAFGIDVVQVYRIANVPQKRISSRSRALAAMAV